MAGLVLVLASVVLGAGLLDAADDTTLVWVVDRDVAAGTTLTAADLGRRQVHLGGLTGQYVPGEENPEGAVSALDLRAGELLPAAAVRPRPEESDVRLVTVSVPTDELPRVSNQPAARVDVWTTRPTTTSPGEAEATATRPLIRGVAVEEVPEHGGLGGQGGRAAVVLALPREGRTVAAFDRLVADVLAATRTGRIYLVAVASPGSAP